ncbi:aminotransferase class I/II-fold pyridoxal phosphate-dependent enzyme [Chitinilyticum piscinae]|uniref:Putative 8-amino-7-oxononanoate synthase n=1 Tax=Chitinilyticum piscinae TaxID=2866724 RepID=A0A8J7FHG5_9NEIS|nr:aminotransferase class I/II-fold pyridoxal phosphate-dependent enzyme [Chitinilyticum piscinae]MBE9607832.1 aminotransferase class I/II-fold pyridoxal phosphate-dependent enzyme [Chitinilyticum piscinae]
MAGKGIAGLTGQLKDKLIQQALERKLKQAEQAPLQPLRSGREIPESFCRFDLHPGYQQLRIMSEGGQRLGVPSPFFKLHDGLAGATTHIGGREYINFASYNYLGLNGHPAVQEAAKQAIDRYGISVSASRPVSGERPVHRELEETIAAAYEVDAAVVFVSGHATNVSTIGMLFGPKDLVIHDEYIHNSALQGMLLSGAKRLSIPHNDLDALDDILIRNRHDFERVLIVVEGIYSMDGDYPDLPRLIEIKQRHRAFLMVDEAHSFGVMGRNGLGLREHFGIAGKAVDIWMGTLSKSLAGCGGYIAGENALVEHLKFLAPGFLYSVGMPAPVAAASRMALNCMLAEPERVQRLQQMGAYFLRQARQLGIDTGASTGLAVIPAIVGSSLRAARLSSSLFEQGINVQPILYPAVPEKAARLRFFISCEHTEEQIDQTLAALKKALADF